MVTFSTDYWAPAMEVNVRRRAEKSSLASGAQSPFLHNDDHWNTLRQVPTIESSSSSSNSDHYGSADSHPVLRKALNGTIKSNKSSESAPLAVPQQKKAHSLIHKIFHHEHKSSSSSPPTSPGDRGSNPIEEEVDPYLLSNTSPLEKRNIFSFVHGLGKGTSPFGSDRGLAQGGSNHANGAGEAKKVECTLLKKYGLCDKGNIGQGATAVVRLAHKLSHDEESEKLFAVKEFRKRRKNETEKEYVKKLTSEFCISSTLHHENIVETVDLVQDEQHHWCEVMEYCRGGDLYNAIKQGYMSRVEIDCCFKQLLNGVAYLHSMGVAHRDIKPENLLLDGKGRLKITDFGVSDVFRMCWEKTPHLSKGLCGSEPYIAPEEFKTKEYDARRVDIWACGIVYYCMVYQGIPFRAATSQDPNYQHFLEMRAVNNYEPFEKLPPGCRKLMKRILDPNPETRITIEEIMEDEWFKSIESCAHGENQNPHRHFGSSI
ncbi:kinase-like domain-containing protein [Gamsiella multidivaricata]|uniref:kinase-like domain-containing protein n=1 Tax=Gamsiella multidivaricata TaxID=101098 RepID=UPI00221EADD1|nr:kinase-like domain-containing protein [Gamsiella multidivaricata]KAG0360674.1 serine/threonine-protein kinase HAL4/sat4 [Gamsiella multidivaricata]KAI7829844.1 kinase-like domain-containing protein [Gamsiella multidivaricata]